MQLTIEIFMQSSKLPSSGNNYPMPFTRIELAIFSIVDGQLCVLLGKRSQEPHQGKWALPGGVLRIDLDKHLEDAAQRVAQERLGVSLPFIRQLQSVGGMSRDSRAPWALSIVYRALLPIEQIKPVAGKRLDELEWRPVSKLTTKTVLAFDHWQLIQSAFAITCHEIDQLDLPFEFMPEKFTLGELQTFCEIFLGKSLDKSSFRRRLDDKDLVEAVPDEMRTGAFRPAQLFRRK